MVTIDILDAEVPMLQWLPLLPLLPLFTGCCGRWTNKKCLTLWTSPILLILCLLVHYLRLLYRWLKLNFTVFTKNGSLLKLLAHNIKYSCHNICDMLLSFLETDFNLHAILNGKIGLWFYYVVCDCAFFFISEPLTDFWENLCGWWKLPPPHRYRVTVWQMYELVW